MNKVGIDTQKIFLLLSISLLVSTFLFLRLNNLPNTIQLFGDTARDLLTLEHWHQTGKPPLLGPHTSALSFNQSAWYFYFLYPFYLLFGGNLYTANLWIITYYLAFFGLGVWLVGKKKLPITIFLILLTLITFHPELIKQTRDVWNPSLVLPAVLIAIGLFLKLKRQMKVLDLFLLDLVLFFSLGASYSAAPVVFSFILMTVFFCLRQKVLKKTQSGRYLLYLIIFPILTAVIVNIGTIAYEFRYGFVLSKNFSNQQVLQTSGDLLDKASNLATFVLGNNQTGAILIAVMILLSFIFSLLPKFRSIFHSDFSLVTGLLLANILMLLLLPFQIHAHYIFGVLALFFVYATLLPRLERGFLLGFLLVTWVAPILNKEYFKSVSPTTLERQTCLRQVCQDYPGQIYVATNSSSHDHQALGYEYLGKKLNCSVISILSLHGNQPQFMAVFNEKAQFDPEKTDFYELNQFGKKQLLKELVCTDRLSATIFTH